MNPRKKGDVEKALRRKGFRSRESHHTFWSYYSTEGKRTEIFTKVSHGHSEISPDNLRKMAKQCFLTNSEFVDLMQCPLSREQYEEILRQKGLKF